MPIIEPVLSGPGAGRTVTSGHGSSAELKLAGEQSGSDWAVVELQVRAGDEPPIHTHTREDETIYVLEGSITAFVADQRIDVDAGSYAALPKGLQCVARKLGFWSRCSRRGQSTSWSHATTRIPIQLGSDSSSTSPSRPPDRIIRKGRRCPQRRPFRPQPWRSACWATGCAIDHLSPSGCRD